MSIANALNAIRLFAQLLPSIHAMIDHYETLFPGSGKGSVRLDAIKAAIQNMMTLVTVGSTTFDALWPLISAEISNVVAIRKLQSITAPKA